MVPDNVYEVLASTIRQDKETGDNKIEMQDRKLFACDT